MTVIIIIFALSVFFAMNMGGSSIAASFAAAYGSGLIKKIPAVFLFGVFVVLGALFLGGEVASTLGKKIIPSALMGEPELIIILVSAGLSLFVANMIGVPQSTSLVTVAAISGVGLFHEQLNMATICRLVPYWIILPLIAYGITYWIGSFVYPPSRKNFWLYERFVNQRSRLKKFVLASSCYNAFSVGTNNVANVVGPLLAAGLFTKSSGLIMFAIIFALGGLVFSGPMQTASHKVVPLGLVTASIVSFVCGSLMIAASIGGIPQSFVMLKMMSLFAIRSLKKGKRDTFEDRTTQLTLLNWSINPLITLVISYALSWVFLK